MANDWALRAQEEIRSTCENPNYGFSIFATHTYKENKLPHFYFCSGFDSVSRVYKPTLYNVPCFNPQHWSKFINTLRKYYERHHRGVVIRYMVCCEYGGKSTHRSHLHSMIHFNNIPSTTENKVEAINRIRDIWENVLGYGYLKYSRPEKGGAIIQNALKNAKYVSKYTTKSYNFFHQPSVEAFLDPTAPDFEDRLKAIKPYLPRHRQSKGFGLSLIDYLHNNLERMNRSDIFDCLVNGFFYEGSDQVLRVPMYIYRKLCYYNLPDGRLILNQFGIDVKAMQLRNVSVPNAISKYSACLDFSALHNISPLWEDTSYLPLVDRTRPFTFQQFHDAIMKFTSKHSIPELVFYKYFLKDRIVPPFLQYINPKSATFYDDCVANYKECLTPCLDLDLEPYHNDIIYCGNEFSDLLKKTYNNLNQFAGFDTMLEYFDKFFNITNSMTYAYRKIENQKCDKVRQFHLPPVPDSYLYEFMFS